MNWPDEYFREQAELILDMFDLTSGEVNVIAAEWHQQIGFIPEHWYDEMPPDFGNIHALAELQRIAMLHVRRRGSK